MQANLEAQVHDYDHPETDPVYRMFGKIPETTEEEIALIEQFKRIAKFQGGMTTFKIVKIVAVVVE